MPTASFRRTDLDIAFRRLKPLARETSVVVYASSSLSISRTPTGYRFAYVDGTEFLVGESGDRITAFTPPRATLEDTSTYLVGPVLRFVLRLRGVVCLHASTAVVGGRAVALCGAPGAGKSSTAAALAQLGYPILAEDVAALDDRGDSFAVQPGYPRVNLWPDSAAALYGSVDALPAITPNWEKRYVLLDGPRTGSTAERISGQRGSYAGTTLTFRDHPAQLTAIYILGDRAPQSEPGIRALGPMETLMALASNTNTPYLDPAMRAREFDVLSRLTRSIPVSAVTPPADIANIGGLCAALLDHFKKLGEAS